MQSTAKAFVLDPAPPPRDESTEPTSKIRAIEYLIFKTVFPNTTRSHLHYTRGMVTIKNWQHARLESVANHQNLVTRSYNFARRCWILSANTFLFFDETLPTMQNSERLILLLADPPKTCTRHFLPD